MTAGLLPWGILPYARPKSTHQISPRVILYRLPHSAHRRMSRGKLFFLRNFVIYGVNTVNFHLIYIRAILIETFFCKQQLNFFYIHYTVLLLYYTYWKCLNRRLSPETQSATLKFELWEAVHELDTVFCCCKFYCISNQYNLCNALFLQKR